MRKSDVIATMMAAVLTLACGDDATEPQNLTLSVTFNNLAPLTNGTYEGWVIDANGQPNSTGTFTLNSNGQHTFMSPIPEPSMFVLTVEPPNDTDPTPSDQKLLGGPFVNGTAQLSALGFVTVDASADFAGSPGTHVLLTPTTATSEDDDAGIWLIQPPAPGGAPTATVTLPVLTAGWVYEGWVVYGPGTSMESPVSYGKFTPQSDGTVSGRDSDAAGPLSGAPGNLEAGPPFPGSDFVAMNGNAIPPGLQLRFDFNGDDATQGDSQWMHVISIEPSFDQGEGTLNATPFLLKPFGNPFGDGGPTDARTIAALAPLPTGTVTTGTSSN